MIHDPRPCDHTCPMAALRATFNLGCCRSVRDDDDTMPASPVFGGPFIPGGAVCSAEVCA